MKEQVQAQIAKSDGILIFGSTLHTRSGREHIEKASKEGYSIGLINIGPSFGDNLSTFKINANCGDVMRKLAQESIF
jgi:NAD-dependent SIR2 family protein deacetylase